MGTIAKFRDTVITLRSTALPEANLTLDKWVKEKAQATYPDLPIAKKEHRWLKSLKYVRATMITFVLVTAFLFGHSQVKAPVGGILKSYTTTDSSHKFELTKPDTTKCILQVVTNWNEPALKWVTGYVITEGIATLPRLVGNYIGDFRYLDFKPIEFPVICIVRIPTTPKPLFHGN